MEGVHSNDLPQDMNHNSNIYCSTVNILLIISSFNGIDAIIFDVRNPYRNVNIYKKVYSIYGKVFGTKADDTIEIVVKGLYGLKSDRALFQNHLVRNIWNSFGFQ